MTNLMYRVYSTLRRALPPSIQEAVGASALMEPLRNRWLRPAGQTRTEMGQIDWEDLQFTFHAPYREYHKARERGVENALCRLARATLRPGDTAIDVGANYGFVTLVMAKSVAPGGRVFSFEINPTIAGLLSETLTRNQLDQVVHLTKKGAGAAIENGLVTVDSVVDNGIAPIQFLKVDTDGSDLEVLLGARAVLERDHPIVVVEMHRNAREIYDLLRACGYTFFQDFSRRPLRIGEWPENLVASVTEVAIPPKGAFIDLRSAVKG